MDKEVETQDSETAAGEATKETSEDTSEESEVVQKNKQLFERAKKAEARAKEIEAEKKALEDKLANLADDDNDETPNTEVLELKKQLEEMKHQGELEKLYGKYPVIVEKVDEFDEYLKENEGMKLEVAAKAFMHEKDLLTQEPERVGLEGVNGGGRQIPDSGKMSSQDVKHLRENDYKLYRKLLNEGKIDIGD